MSIYAGLDGGSTYLKAAILDGSRRVLHTGVVSTGIDNNRAAEVLLGRMCEELGVGRPDYIMATGYSRKILELADDDVSEITAHAYGVRVTAPKEFHPGLIVDIGGQDSKVIYLDSQYRVKNFSMNDKCAAGTGKFMEVIAQILETTIEQVGPLSLESRAPCEDFQGRAGSTRRPPIFPDRPFRRAFSAAKVAPQGPCGRAGRKTCFRHLPM